MAFGAKKPNGYIGQSPRSLHSRTGPAQSKHCKKMHFFQFPKSGSIMATASRCLRQKPREPDREGPHSVFFLMIVEMEGMIFETGLRDFSYYRTGADIWKKSRAIYME